MPAKSIKKSASAKALADKPTKASIKKKPVNVPKPAPAKVLADEVSAKRASAKADKKPELNVVCMAWLREDGTKKFSEEYVNRLYRMVQKNLTLPHRFVCFTDYPDKFDDGIETFPVPKVRFPKGCPERGWKKLGLLLSGKVEDLKGTALFLDLDTVIVDNIDDLFKVPGKFLIARDKANNDKEGNSSVVRFEIGKHQDVLDYFEKNFDRVRHEVRREQQFLSNEMQKKGIFQFWPNENWCASFKYKSLLRFPLNWFIAPKIPKGAKVVIFHGRPNNEQAMKGYTAKFGLRHVKPTKWIRKYWIDA
ncbi:MAG: glycosyltransferase [Alphaproteobacteria bacterium]|nr:glycosyltransferase [Alphaproteobacteria bacterium]